MTRTTTAYAEVITKERERERQRGMELLNDGSFKRVLTKGICRDGELMRQKIF